MYLAVMIDGEHYTDMEAYPCNSIQEGFDLFKKNFVMDYSAKYRVNNNRIVATYYTWSYLYEDFSVCEVYKVDEKPYTLVWWHAYDGVDFTVRTFDSFDEARETMITEAGELMSKLEDAQQDSDEGNFICVDTGIEWECWKIIKRESKK